MLRHFILGLAARLLGPWFRLLLAGLLVTACDSGPFGNSTTDSQVVSRQLSHEANKQCIAQLEKIDNTLKPLLDSQWQALDEWQNNVLAMETLQTIDNVSRLLAELEGSLFVSWLASDSLLESDHCLSQIIEFRHQKLNSPALYQRISAFDTSYFDTSTQHMVNKWLMAMRHSGAHLSGDIFQQVVTLRTQLANSELSASKAIVESGSNQESQKELLVQQAQSLFEIANFLGYPEPLGIVRAESILPMPGDLERFIENGDTEINRYLLRELEWLRELKWIRALDGNHLLEAGNELDQLSNSRLTLLLGIPNAHPMYSWGIDEWQESIHNALAQTLELEFIPLDRIGKFEVYYTGRALGQVSFHHLNGSSNSKSSSEFIVEQYPNSEAVSSNIDQADANEPTYHVFLNGQHSQPIALSSWQALTASYGELLHAMLVDQQWWSNGYSDVDPALKAVSRQWFQSLISSYDFIQFGFERRVKRQKDLSNGFAQVERAQRLVNALLARKALDNAKLKIQWLAQNDMSVLRARLSQGLFDMDEKQVASFLTCEALCLSNVIGFFVTNQLNSDVQEVRTFSSPRERMRQVYNQFVERIIKPGSSRHPIDILSVYSEVDLYGKLH